MPLDLLLEIGAEDLPARYVAPLAEALGRGIGDGLARRGIAHGDLQRYATPRRIAVLLQGVAEEQPQQTLERSGPALSAAIRDGKPTPAGLGFAKSCGVDFPELGEKDGKLFFRRTVPGRATAELLPEIFEETLKSMDELVPKRMRWGSGDETFVRPVQWLLCLFGGDVVPLQRFGLEAGRITYGHRFHAPAAIALSEPRHYEDALRQAKVWADLVSRRTEIRRQVEEQAQQLGGGARIAESLLDEVAALVEWPVVVAGRMEDRFMILPPEVIVSTVETNQRYFTLFADSAQTQLLPYFITVCNIESQDVAQVIAGNERVVRPRLSDALFFWEQDLKQPLESYAGKLSAVTFVKGLGSVADKAGRLARLGAAVARLLGADEAAVVRAAQLAKNDLVTRMVYEFPELQGLMGGYYAQKSGETAAVAAAVREHYLPAQQGTAIPSTPEGRILALADRLDTLAGIFALGQKPSASKDPFALRRAALGSLRILVEGELDLDLRALLQIALELQPAGKRDAATLDELWAFVLERLRSYCADRGAGAEAFEAVRASGSTRPLDFDRRLRALLGFLGSAEAQSLAAADKRARNILKQAGSAVRVDVDPALLEMPAERNLLAELDRVARSVEPLRGAADYDGMLRALAALKQPVDAFFDAVMVMADDAAVRANRLALLARLDTLCREVADLSLLPG